MPIYTKKGDSGTTTFFDKKLQKSERVSKNDARIWAIGTLDELNCYLGICANIAESAEIKKYLKEIQINIFTINSILSGAKIQFGLSKIRFLEQEIDKITEKLPKLTNFVIPSGSEISVHLQYARALCRNAERRVVLLNELSSVNKNILMYVNRLSDFLFTLSRKTNFDIGVIEERWIR